MEWLKEAGYEIYVHGARVETGANEPIHDGMARLEQTVRHFLEVYNIQVWGDLMGLDLEMGCSSRTAGEVTGPDAAENTSGRRTALKSGTILVCTGAWDRLLDNSGNHGSGRRQTILYAL